MDLQYENPGFEYSIDSIMLFQKDEQNSGWLESLYYFFPEISKEHIERIQPSEKRVYLADVLKGAYIREEQIIKNKAETYNKHWQLHKAQIEDAFSDSFSYDCRNNFNSIIGNITLNPICPRFLESHTFDVFYENGKMGALGIALHEITHFVWFRVWQEHFQDNIDEYETPYLKWVFSEMAVDSVMRRDKRLSELNPFFDEGCAYGYFYKMTVNGKLILDTLYNMYKGSDIIGFMEQGYDYCLKHEADIRAQMQ